MFVVGWLLYVLVSGYASLWFASLSAVFAGFWLDWLFEYTGWLVGWP